MKLLDTSFTLSSGDVMSCGFTRVANETADTITQVTKDAVLELASIHAEGDEETFVRDILLKLTFTMTDRAANEKKSNRQIASWRDDVVGDGSTVHQFNCMAHALLGFHSYSKKPIKEMEKELGPIGRQALPVFARWRDMSTAVERTCCMMSEVFGPVGDHHGVRDRWEAHCSRHGIKNFVSAYKDNRFNALFRSSAELIHHRDDFISVLQTVTTPNLKIKSVLADISCPVVIAMVQAVALLYIKVNDPYWNLVTSSSVEYLKLYQYIQPLHDFLQQASDEPGLLLNDDFVLWNDVPISPAARSLQPKVMHIIHPAHTDLLHATVKLVCQAMMSTIKKQLIDFMPGGQYSTPPSDEDLERTGFAHVTNLGCEHHFGDLDSSQRRRPNCSLFHHSTIQMLKRNKGGIADWLHQMSNQEKEALFTAARKQGRQMRSFHSDQERQVQQSLSREMQKEPKKKNAPSSTKTAADVELELAAEETLRENLQDELARLLPQNFKFKEGQYVAVAFQEGWYPGKINYHKPCM
jgi:hypothetical protein